MATPPIDGVPRFLWWLGGPSSNLVAEALPGEESDQDRGQQDRHRQRDADGDEDLPHEATNASASFPSPAAFDALTSTTSPSRSSARNNFSAASASATMVASPPHEPSMTAP